MHVPSAGLASATLRAGSKIRFEAVSHEAALGLRRRHLADLERLAEKIVPLRRADAELAAVLSASNLIRGVVDANA